MFDTTIHKHESKVVAITKEIEKTISPDKVTEMYDAVREEVENSIIRSIVVDDNSLKGSAVEIEQRYDTDVHIVLLRLILNGTEHLGRETLTRDTVKSEVNLYEKLRDFYIKTVTNEVMRQTIEVVPKVIRSRF